MLKISIQYVVKRTLCTWFFVVLPLKSTFWRIKFVTRLQCDRSDISDRNCVMDIEY